MPTVEAHITTDRASRYLVQLCQHSGRMPGMLHRSPTGRRVGHLPPTVQHVDWTNTTGTIHFPQGKCTLAATPDALTVRLDADDENSLRQLQDGVTRRLETIGRRDNLTVHWRHLGATPGVQPGEASTTAATTKVRAEAGRRRRLIRALLLVAAVALAIALHLGVLGTALATSPWVDWGTKAVVAIILLKLVMVAAGGRIALRHGRASRRGRKNRQAPPDSMQAAEETAGHATGPLAPTE